MNNDRLLSAISMARGAGKLKIGFDATADAALKGAPLTVLASDASDRTRTAVERVCEGMTELVFLERTQEEIENTVGRRFAVAAVTDENFAALIKKQLGK